MFFTGVLPRSENNDGLILAGYLCLYASQRWGEGGYFTADCTVDRTAVVHFLSCSSSGKGMPRLIGPSQTTARHWGFSLSGLSITKAVSSEALKKDPPGTEMNWDIQNAPMVIERTDKIRNTVIEIDNIPRIVRVRKNKRFMD